LILGKGPNRTNVPKCVQKTYKQKSKRIMWHVSMREKRKKIQANVKLLREPRG